MSTKICHKKLTQGYVNICTLLYGTMKVTNNYCDCPARIEANRMNTTEEKLKVNCSQYRSMNKRY